MTMVNPPSLKTVTEGDIPTHFATFQHLLKATFPHFPEQFFRQWSLERLTLIARDNGVICLFHQEKPIGFSIMSPPEGGVGTLFWLLVDNAYQRQGLGSHLLAHVEEHYQARGCHKVKLTAPSRKACHFYEKKGFMVEGFHPHHWYQLDFWSLAKQILRTL